MKSPHNAILMPWKVFFRRVVQNIVVIRVNLLKLDKSWGKRKGFKYAFSNSDLNGYESILSSGDQLLNMAKRIDCLLKNEADPSKIIQSIDTILKSEHLIGYMFNSIYELLQRLKKDGEFSLLEKFKQN